MYTNLKSRCGTKEKYRYNECNSTVTLYTSTCYTFRIVTPTVTPFVTLHAGWDGRFSRKVVNWAAGRLWGVTADELKQAYIRYPDEIHPANMDGIATELMRRVTDIPVTIYIPISLNPVAAKKICTQASHETINDYCVEYKAGAAVLKVSSRYNQTKEALKDGFTRFLLLKVAELAM